MKKLALLTLILYALFNPKAIIAPTSPVVMAKEIVVDPRVEKLEDLFREYDSPLTGHANSFIRAADTFGLDWRLLPAIAGSESTFAKFTPSCADYNPFGWTSTTSPCGFWRFDSFDEAVQFVAEKIKTKDAYSEFQKTGNVRDLALSYNPGGPEEWTAKVDYFIEKLK